MLSFKGEERWSSVVVHNWIEKTKSKRQTFLFHKVADKETISRE